MKNNTLWYNTVKNIAHSHIAASQKRESKFYPQPATPDPTRIQNPYPNPYPVPVTSENSMNVGLQRRTLVNVSS